MSHIRISLTGLAEERGSRKRNVFQISRNGRNCFDFCDCLILVAVSYLSKYIEVLSSITILITAMKLFGASLFAAANLAAPITVRQATITDVDILQFALTVR
jgi:hypothetical protein